MQTALSNNLNSYAYMHGLEAKKRQTPSRKEAWELNVPGAPMKSGILSF